MTRLLFFSDQWLLLSLIYFIAGCFLPPLDIAVHDTYYVIDGFHAGVCFALLYGVIWLFYRFIPAFSTFIILSKIHLVLTSIWGLSLLLLLYFPRPITPRYSDYSVNNELTTSSFTIDYSIYLLLLLFPFIQAIWIVQLIGFIVKRLKQQ